MDSSHAISVENTFITTKRCEPFQLAPLFLIPCGNTVAVLNGKAPGVIGSALRLVGPASVYCDWVR